MPFTSYFNAFFKMLGNFMATFFNIYYIKSIYHKLIKTNYLKGPNKLGSLSLQ